MKTEHAMQAVKELQSRLKEVLNEKRDLEMEFICLRKNYITIQKELAGEKEKRKGLELDMVNI
jgi:predicted transcriptional regulator